MPKAKTQVAFIGNSYIVRFKAAIGMHPDIPQDLKLSDCRASFVAKAQARRKSRNDFAHVTSNLQAWCFLR